MSFAIEFSQDAERHLRALPAHDAGVLLDEIAQQLTHQPNVATRHRKLLRPTPLATWELRVGDYRVFYNVAEDPAVVVVIAVGRKEHNKLFIDGKEYTL